MPLTAYYLLPTTYYLLPTTYYLLPTTYYPIPTAYYLLPTTYYLRMNLSSAWSAWWARPGPCKNGNTVTSLCC